MQRIYSADFETTTDPEDCRVWASGIVEVGNPDNYIYYNNIDEFITFMERSDNSTFYFHNLKFDGEFIMCWLFEHGYKHVVERSDIDSKTFTTLISDKGQFYSIKIYFKKQGKRTKSATIYDSLKILPFSVEVIAKSFNLPISKLKIDYNAKREVGHELTQEEIDYLRNDVDIVARALNVLFKQGMNKMTQGSNALADYKNIVSEKSFNRWFPIPEYDADVRQAYRGGFTYCNPKYQEKDIEEGIVLDVNSLYPSVMYYQSLPYDEGIYFQGKYEEDKLYNLYIQQFKCQFVLKEDHIPTIQLKNNLAFIPTEYLTSSGEEEVILTLTSVDLELFLDHYEVYNIEYIGGWKFKSHIGMFKDYIDKWTEVKIKATVEKNAGMRTLAKLMLNALYGKFALNPNVQSKIPFYFEGMVKYTLGEKETREPIYIPVGVFVTAWARYKTIRSAQKVYDRFVYADTDSLHLIGTEIPDELEIHPTKLGAWKWESSFKRARFIRAKCYIEDEYQMINDNTIVRDTPIERLSLIRINKGNVKVLKTTCRPITELKITCAGMPDRCYKEVTWENFHRHQVYHGKLQQKHVKGGIILKDIDFTIK